MRPTYAEINLKNLLFNYSQIRKKTKTKIIAVVKADSYGHGMIECVKALKSHPTPPEYYAVALYEEAIELRKSNVTDRPILCFAPIDLDEIENYIKNDIIATISDITQLKGLQKANFEGVLNIHLKLDTGMGRVGVKPKDLGLLITLLAKVKNISIKGIYTHFATSDEKDKTFANFQLTNFKKMVSELKNSGINPEVIHAANSGAILDMPEAYFDAVRPGIALYGYYPSNETSESIKLKPVMSLISKITTIKKIGKGESVSYGRLFFADEDTTVATVPIGYADGYNRNLTNKAIGFIGGEKVNQVGRVTMDRILFEIKNKNVKLGNKIILMGNSGSMKFDADDWSKILNTIPYEVTCNISKRVPRVYKK